MDGLQGTVCARRPREPLWTLTKGGRRVDAELLSHAEHGVEVQFLHEGVMAFAHRFVLAAKHAEEAISALLADKMDLTVQVQKREPFAVAADRPAVSRQPRDRLRAVPSDNGNLPAGERVVLTAVAQYAEGADRTQLSILTGYKRSTRDRYLQFLAQKGLVAMRGDRLVATGAGAEALGDFEPLPTGDALREYWMAHLPEGERVILAAVTAGHPDAVSREAIDQATGYKRSTRDRYIQFLQARKLVAANREGVVASRELFS